MRIVSFLSLLYFSISAFLIAIINHSGLPSSFIIEGRNIVYVPILIGIADLVAAIFSILESKKNISPPLMKPPNIRWLLMIGAAFFPFCAFTMFSVSLFSPFLFGSNQPAPGIGVICSLIIALILSAILFFASRMNSTRKPNLFRYIALVVAFIAVSLTTVQCLMLIYAVPVQPPTAYPFLSGILSIAFIPFSLLILIISKSYVAVK